MLNILNKSVFGVRRETKLFLYRTNLKHIKTSVIHVKFSKINYLNV